MGRLSSTFAALAPLAAAAWGVSASLAVAQPQTSEQQQQLAAECAAAKTELAALEKSQGGGSSLASEIAAEQRQVLLTCKPHLPPPPPPGPPNLVTVYGLEITQAVQDLNNSVPLVAGKQTWARIYVDPFQPASPQTLNVTLQVAANGTTSKLSAFKAVTVTPISSGDWSARKQWATSVNVQIPSQFTKAGTVTFTVTGITDTHGQSGVYGCYTGCGNPVSLTFQDEPPLIVKVFGLKYNLAGPGQPVSWAQPRTLDFSTIRSWLGRAYPVSTVDYSQRTIVLDESDGTTTATQADIQSGAVNCNTGDAQLAAIRAQDIDSGTDARTHYYGMVFNQGGYYRGCADGVPSSPDPATTASGPTGSGATGPPPVGYAGEPSFGGWYGGHEIGHTFGRAHPGFCNGNSHSDPHFPYPNGWISNGKGDSFAGADVGDPSLPAASSIIWVTDFDIMTYCNQPQWLSAYAYEGVLQRILAENPGFSTSGGAQFRLREGAMVDVAAVVNLTRGQGVITSVAPVSHAAPIVNASSRVTLVVRDAKGAELSHTQVPLREDSDSPSGEDLKAVVEAAIDLPPGAAQVDLVLDGKTIATYRPAAAAPAPIANLRLDTAVAGDRVVRWDKTAPDADASHPTTYIIQVSKDGQTWETVAVGARSPTVPIADADVKHVRVIATNGFVRTAPVELDLRK